MKCTNCGTEIEPGSLFCSGCGMKVSEMTPVEPVASAAPAAPVPNLAQALDDDATVVVDDVFAGPVGEQPTNEQPTNGQPACQQPQPSYDGSAPGGEPPRKKHGFLVIGVLAIIVVLVVVAAIALFKALGSAGGGSSDKKLAYEKDGYLYYVSNMDKDKDPVEVDKDRDDGFGNFKFSENGTYLYYLSNDGRGTLNRAQVDKLKNDSSKNSKYITEIDSKVYSYCPVGDKELYYLTTNGRLYYYDGKSEEEIDKDVDGIVYDQADKKGIYYYDNDYKYYYYDVSKKDTEKLPDDFIYTGTDWENGVFLVQDKDEVYTVTLSGDEEELTDDVGSLLAGSAANGILFYTKDTYSFDDYDDDDYYDEDDYYEDDYDSYDSSTELYMWTKKGGEQMVIDDMNISGVALSDDGKTLIVGEYDNDEITAYSYSVESTGITKIGKLADDLYGGEWVDNSFYYFTDVDDDSTGDLMVYKNGKEKTLAEDLYVYGCAYYADGNVCGYGDSSDKDLRIYNSKGEDTKIKSDVSAYVYINSKRIVYYRDGKLSVYTGKGDDHQIVRGLESTSDYTCLGEDAVFSY